MKFTMKRFNGWQRIGVVFSVLWCLLIAILAYQYTGFIDPWDRPILDHFSEFLGLPYLGPLHKLVVVILAGALPIAGGWLIIYGVLWTVKWVMVWFKQESGI
jgi:hypothetical protein